MLAELKLPDLSGFPAHLGAELLLALAVPTLLLADLFAPRARRAVVAGSVAGFAFVAAFVLALLQPESASEIGRVLRADGLAKAIRLVALATGMVGAVAALRGGDPGSDRTEFFALLVTAVLGACLTASANEMATLYLAIETLSISGYLLAGFKRRDPRSAEAALKYVIFGAISSGMMLYGLTLLYGFAGSSMLSGPGSLRAAALHASGSPAFVVAVVLVFAGLAYKIAAFPFQFWCPDVYHGAPTSVAAFLAVAGKAAGFAALLRFLDAATYGGEAATEALRASNETVRLVLVGMAIATMTFGNVAALRQRNAKRLLAYSAIAHAGYLLMGVAVTNGDGTAAVLFYMVVYLFMTLGAFFFVALVERETGSTDLQAFSGLGFKSPYFAVCVAVCMIGLTGLPPTGGFVGKFFLFREVFAYGGANASDLFLWFGVIGLLNGVVSLAYYARFLKAMYLAEPEAMERAPLALTASDRGLAFALTLPVLVLGLAFGGLYDRVALLASGIF